MAFGSSQNLSPLPLSCTCVQLIAGPTPTHHYSTQPACIRIAANGDHLATRPLAHFSRVDSRPCRLWKYGQYERATSAGNYRQRRAHCGERTRRRDSTIQRHGQRHNKRRCELVCEWRQGRECGDRYGHFQRHLRRAIHIADSRHTRHRGGLCGRRLCECVERRHIVECDSRAQQHRSDELR